jgi:hypothetical protein
MTRHLTKTAAAAAVACALLASITPQAQAAGPAYTWSNVKIGGTGYVPGIVAHTGQKGLFYARTDMGGAYRYQAATSSWVPLTDWAPATNGNQLGIDSIAVDPRDVSRLYMVVGSYFWASKGTFLSSSNQGASFTQVELPFTTGANEGGRQVGERLQVDPNNGAVLFYGTANNKGNASSNGLWTSTNRGAAWSKVAGFPTLSSDGTGAGVAFVAFHGASAKSGQTTPTLFAAINTKTAAENGAVLYRSNDAGRTWSAVNGAPHGVMPQRGQIGPDGNLYVTFAAPATYAEYSGGPQVTHYDGPNGLTDGQVWKYNVSSGAWTNITPPNSSGSRTSLGYAFSGLSVDPWRSGVLVVNTLDRWWPNDTFYRSTDGGATWTDLQPNATFDVSASPWTGPVTHWGGWPNSVLDPYDYNHAFVAWGGGIKETKNLTSAKTNWTYGHDGIEETAVTTLVSPTANAYNAYPLISGGKDICGFTHPSVTASPPTVFSNPGCSETTSLAYARNDSRIVVRAVSGSTTQFGGISWNGGYSWSAFNSNGGSSDGGGGITINTDGSTILWSPSDVAPVYSSNSGYSWTSLAGQLPKGSLIAADGYNANLFYAYDPASGAFYSSGNKAAGWAKATTLPTGGRQIAVTPGVQGDVWVAVEWGGLYHDTASGWGSWPKVAGVEIVRAIGFGKAAAGTTYPAIYLSGKVSGVDGFFRSIDGGNSWVRINDDQHQWGGAWVITGDPKTFGTVYIGTNGRGVIQGTSTN